MIDSAQLTQLSHGLQFLLML